jgi:predicted DNA-binding protein
MQQKSLKVRRSELTVNKPTTVAFRLPTQVKEALHSLATSRGETMAEFCEKLVIRELRREGVEIILTTKLV